MERIEDKSYNTYHKQFEYYVFNKDNFFTYIVLEFVHMWWAVNIVQRMEVHS